MATVMRRGLRFKRAPRFAPPAWRGYAGDLRAIAAFVTRKFSDALLARYPRFLAALDVSKHQRSDADDASISVTIDGVRAEIEPLATAQAARVARKQADGVKTGTRAKANKQVKALKGVEPIAQEPWLSPLIDSFVEANAGLMKKLVGDQASRVSQIVREGALGGVPQKEIAKQLDSVLETGMRHAKFVARDQTAKLNSQLTEVRMRRAGIDQYQWSGSMDERERETHRANEGKIFSWDSPPAATGHPGQDPNCRCVPVPIFAPASE